MEREWNFELLDDQFRMCQCRLFSVSMAKDILNVNRSMAVWYQLQMLQSETIHRKITMINFEINTKFTALTISNQLNNTHARTQYNCLNVLNRIP